MNTLGRQLLLVTLGLALTIAAPVRAVVAQEAEPAIVVSLANIDKLLGDVAYLTRAAGTPEVGGLVTLMAGQYIEGLDTKKPAGVAFSLNGQTPSGLAFLGVRDFDTVLRKIEESVGEPEDLGNGVKKLALQRNVFFKEANGWIFISDAAANLDNAPQDPTKLLGDLPKQYNVAVQVNVQQIPEPLRQMAISEMREGFERGLQNQEDEDQREMQEKLGRRGIENLVEFIEGAQRVTLGWGVNSQEAATYLDFTVTAVPGSPLAERFQAIEGTTTHFAGFELPDAAASLRFSAPITADDIEQSKVMLQVMRDQLMKEIDKDDDLPDDEARQTAKDVVNSLLDVLVKTVESGRVDGGAVLLLEEDSLQFVAGGYVADGAAIETNLKKLVELAKRVEEDAKLDQIKFNAAKHRDVNLHTLVVPIPEDEEEARRVLGPEFNAVVGTGPKSAYLAIGRDSLELLKQVIDRSAEAGEVAIAPLTLNVALEPIMAFAAALEDDPKLDRLAQSLQQMQGKDTISLSAKAIPRGATYRFQVDEGVLQLIGQAARMKNEQEAEDQ